MQFLCGIFMRKDKCDAGNKLINLNFQENLAGNLVFVDSFYYLCPHI